MSEEKQPKKAKTSEEEQSEYSDDGPRHELSPDDEDDRCLLPIASPAGAEPLPTASESGGACSSSATQSLTGLFKKISPFKSKDSSKAEKPPCKKIKEASPFVKAKNAFRKTFRRSEPIIKGNDPEMEEKRRRKYSDPTHSKTKAEPKTEDEQPGTESEPRSKKSLFEKFTGTKAKTKEPRAKKESKTKKEPKAKKEPKSKKGRFGHSSASTSKTTANSECQKETSSPEAQKKVLSPRTSNQPSIGAVSVGFFNEGLLPSESSGNPTESTSLDIKSGSSFSPDAPSRRNTTSKRPRSTTVTDEEFSSD